MVVAGGFGRMLCDPTICALTPHPEAACFHLRPHQFDYLFFGKTELRFNRFKRGAVFPRHLDDAVNVLWRKLRVIHERLQFFE